MRDLRITSHQGKIPLLGGLQLPPYWSEVPLEGHKVSAAWSMVHISVLAPKLTEICEELHAEQE